MLEEMTAAQHAEWDAFFRVFQIGDDPNYRADLRAGTVAAQVYNANRGAGTQPAAPADFLPAWGPAKPAWLRLKEELAGRPAPRRDQTPRAPQRQEPSNAR